MDTQNFQPEQKEVKQKADKSEFRRGIAAGMLGMLLVVGIAAAVIGVFWKKDVLQEKVSEAGSEESTQESTKETISSTEVEKKAGTIADILDQFYYEDIDEEALVDGMYAGMVEGIGDPYTCYYTAEEYDSLMETTTGTYYGIGAVLTQDAKTNEVTILHVYSGTPAEEAGVKDGDVIVKVDDVEGNSMELSELVKHIKGEEGTTVHLKLLREGETDYLDFDVERRQVEIPTVEYQMLEGKIGLIQISEFSDNTSQQFDDAIKDLQEQGMEAMIVDLRDNPGGVLTAVCDMLDEILPAGTMVYTEDKYGNRSDYDSDESCLDIPMAVLINENSASASEIFAGAIKDYEYGTLIGTTSFGKGIVQSIIPLEDGSAVKVTMAKYFTPKGNYIHEKGIAPDIELEYEYQGDRNADYNPMQDNQVLKAIEVLTQ